MKKRILVFSADAMVCEDVDALRQLPNFQKYLAGGCEVTGQILLEQVDLINGQRDDLAVHVGANQKYLASHSLTLMAGQTPPPPGR